MRCIKRRPRNAGPKGKVSWNKLGRLYGYAKCCIKFFENGGWLNYSKEDMVRYEASPFQYTGLIPCPTCLQKRPQIVLKMIKLRRAPHLPAFPSG